MCAAYTIQGPVQNFEEFSLLPLTSHLPYAEMDQRIVPYRPAPVIVQKEKEYQLLEMSFSLVPSWSKDRKVKFATHNARLETVLEKPTWKRPFLTQRALVPMSYFVEPIYDHELAGNMVQFRPQPGTLLFAAGIYDEWMDPATGELFPSFSILTKDPPEFIARTGHDRCPVFLKTDAFRSWLVPEKKEGDELMHLLETHVNPVEFTTAIDRPMKPGWEKRKS